MSQAFDPYYLWLGIPPVEQPPHFYRLLGLRPLEGNPQVIDNAAQRVTAHLRNFLNNPAHQSAAQWLIGEVTRASECLLDPQQKVTYDSLLAARLSSPAVTTPVASSPAAQTPAPLTPKIVAAPVQLAMPVTRPAGAARPAPPTKKQERIPQPVKIIFGGVAGLAMGYFVVYFLTGNDVFGLLPSRNPPVAERPPVAAPPRQAPVRAANPTPQRLPMTTDSLPPASTIEPSPPPPPPTTAPSPATKSPPVQPSSPPFPPVPRPNFAAPPSTMQPPPSSVPPPLNLTPLPGTTPAAAASPLPAKRPVPTTEDQQKSLAELQALYKTEFDKGSKGDGRAPFVAFLVETGRKLKSDPVAQFVLYREAYQRALTLDDLFTVAEVIDELERTFDIDGYVFRMNLLTAAVKSAKAPEERLTCIHFVLHMADYAQATARIEDLSRLAGMAENLARSVPSKDAKTQASNRATLLRRTVEEFAPVSAARQRLVADAADPAASLIDGKFRCFVQGDWTRGLPLLAQSDHAALATAAKQDLAGPTDTVKPAAIGDAWFDMGAVDPALAGAYARAQHWYQQAAQSLDGLDKVKVEKRLEQIAAMKLPSQLTAKGDAARLASARSLLTRAKPLAPTDVLAAITPESFRTQGWTVGTLSTRIDKSAVFARLQAPLNPTGEYQVALRVSRYVSSQVYGPLAIGLPHWQSQFVVLIDVPTADMRYASFLTISGLRRPDDNPTLKASEVSAPRIDVGSRHIIAIAVRRREILVNLDGQPLLEFKGDVSKLYLPKDWAVPDARAMFLGAHQGGFDISGWAVAPFVAEDGTELPLLTDPQQIRNRAFLMNRLPGQ